MFLGMGGEGTLEQFDVSGCPSGRTQLSSVNTPTFPVGTHLASSSDRMYYQV